MQNLSVADDVVIVGGGPVGATLALLLGHQGINVVVLEARAKGAAYDEKRALALSYGSRKILEKLGVWPQVALTATKISTIHISQQGSFGRTILNAQDEGLEALGYVVYYGALAQALDEALQHCPTVNFVYEAQAQHIAHQAAFASVNVQHAGALKTFDSSLVVLADGGRSLDEIAGLTRETKAYGHDALIAKITAELPHNDVAYERFTPGGPMALLPNGGRQDSKEFSLVWTGKTADVAPLMQLSDAAFLAQFHAAFGDRVGQFTSVGKRMTFPLKLSKLVETNFQHLVVIGNAAQTMHPVAGQGFNVGMRDAESLANIVVTTPREQLGDATMLAQYQKTRARDTQHGLLFTDFLVNIFSNNVIGLNALRGFGLGLLDVLKPAKKILIRKMSYGK